jgi:hypothetical protein
VATASIAVGIALAACSQPGTSPSHPVSRPTAPPPSSDAATRTAAAYYFGAVRQLDSDVSRKATVAPVAFWRVETETTPSVDAAEAALAYMASRYANHGRAIILRMDFVNPTDSGSGWTTTVSLVWNPTSTVADPGIAGRLNARALYVSAGRFPPIGITPPDITYTVSDVATDILSPGSSPRQLALRRVLQASGLQ